MKEHFLVIRGIGLRLILGAEYLWRHGSRIDYGRRVLQASRNMVPVPLVKSGSRGKPVTDARRVELGNMETACAEEAEKTSEGHMEAKVLERRAKEETQAMYSPDVIFLEEHGGAHAEFKLTH